MVKTSVVITNYNYGRYLGRCIRSCLNQSMPRGDYEIIVVDDGSTDNSRKIIDSFKGDVTPVLIGKNSGVANASNEGIKKAKGMFVIRVDADDYINTNMLLVMTEILMWNPDIGFVYCDHLKVNEKEKILNRLDNIEKLYNHGAGVMFRKSNLEAIGLYDAKLKNCEDYDLLIRYFRNFDGYYIKLPLYRYTQHGTNMTKNIKKRRYWLRKVLGKHKK